MFRAGGVLRLGELLLEDGLVTRDQLEKALSLQKSRGGLLGAALVELGYLTETVLAAALARRYGIATVDVSETLPERRLVRDFFARVPRERAAELKVIPLARRGRTLTLAMAEPTNVAAIDEVVSRTGLVVEPVHASARAILEGLEGLDGLAAYRAQWRPRFPRPPRLDKTVDFLTGTDTSSLSFADRPSTSRHLGETKEGALVGAILVDGARSGASYVHVDFEWTVFRVRYRIEGKLVTVFQRANREGAGHDQEDDYWRVIMAFRHLAHLEEGFYRPQYGTLSIRFVTGGATREVDFEVSYLLCGESVRIVLRRAAARGSKDGPAPPRSREGLDRALIAAARDGQVEAARLLLAEGADPDSRQENETALLAASRGGHSDVVEALLERGAPVRMPGAALCHGLDPLVVAAYGGHTGVVRSLLARGGFDEESRARALELASVEGHADTVSVLLAVGAPIRDEALLGASRRGRIDALRLLLSAQPAIDGRLIETALEEAAFCGRGDAVDVLLKHAPESAPLESILRSAVFGAGMFRRELLRGFVTGGEQHGVVVRSLLRARLFSRRAQGPVGAGFLTPLLVTAVESRNHHVVSALLDYGADPNLVPEDGMPPLMVAVQARDAALVKLLLDAGARAKVEWLASIDRATLQPFLPQLIEGLDVEDTRLVEAYSWAESEGYTDLAKVLEEAGSRERLDGQLIEEIRFRAAQGEPELNLSGRQLTRLPVAVFEIDAFESLKLTRSGLSEVPREIGKLGKLRRLDLSGNGLHELPWELSSLQELRSLSLADNWLTRLPELVRRLPALEELDIGINPVAELPDWVGELLRLRALDLSHTAISRLPESIREMTALRSLSLGGTRLRYPGPVDELTPLERLDLSNLGWIELPPQLCGLRNLRFLSLRGNQISFLPEGFSDLSSLVELDLGDNRFPEIPKVLAGLTGLRRLHLDGNPLRDSVSG